MAKNNKKLSAIILLSAVFLNGCGAMEEVSVVPQTDVVSETIISESVSPSTENYKFTVVPDVPEKYKGKNILRNEAELEYDRILNLDNIMDYNDVFLLTAKVVDINYICLSKSGAGGSPWTVIDVVVTDNLNSNLKIGTNLKICTYGGYISLRENLSDVLYMTGDKYESDTNITEEEIDNSVYYEVVNNGELPIINQEYAFCLKKTETINSIGDYELIGGIYGILLKNNDTYIYRSSEMDKYGENMIENFTRNDLLDKYCNTMYVSKKTEQLQNRR